MYNYVYLFGRKKNFSDFINLQSFLFQNYATTAKVGNGHFWTILIEFRVFSIIKSLRENFLDTICT